MQIDVKTGNPKFTDESGIQGFMDSYSLSKEQLAELAGVSERTIDGWISGRNVSTATMFRLYLWEMGRQGNNRRSIF